MHGREKVNVFGTGLRRNFCFIYVHLLNKPFFLEVHYTHFK